MAFPEKFDQSRLHDIEYKTRNTAENEEYQRLMKASIHMNDPYLNYELLPIEYAPTRMYTSDPRPEIKNIHQKFHGYFTICKGYKIFTEEGYQLIQQFNLGQGTQFSPIRLYHYETNQPVNNETYYLMCLTDWRNYLLPEFCEGELYDFSTTKGGVISNWLTPDDEFNDAIALSSEASNCDLDLWHDTALYDSLFMSDRLKQAGFLPRWNVLSTQLIHKQSGGMYMAFQIHHIIPVEAFNADKLGTKLKELFGADQLQSFNNHLPMFDEQFKELKN